MKEQREGFLSFMDAALDEARAAAARGEVPVGAVVVRGGEVVARAGNRTREFADPTAHAEMMAIREACRVLGSERLVGHDLYVTLEPCPMCAAAISAARIGRLYYGRRTRNRAASRSGRGFSATPSATMSRRSMTGSGGARRRHC
jgi:tRNA(adenine34) deaminase